MTSIEKAKAAVVIVGGGPAGISTALFLAHADPSLTERIVVLEKEHYPRDKFCAGGIGARADKLLTSIDVAVDVPSAHVSGVKLHLSPGVLIRKTGAIGRVVRRIEFDRALAQIAIGRGIQVIEGAHVQEVRIDDAGVRIETTRGSFASQVVIGADGVGSTVRRAMGLSTGQFRAQVIELDTEPLASDEERDLLLFDASDRRLRGYYWDFPTLVNGEALVCRGIYHLKMAGDSVDIQEILRQKLAARGLCLSHYRQKRYAERGFEMHTAIARPRALLVGEAAGIDPLTGEGIAQAIAYGHVMGGYLPERLRSQRLQFADFRRYLRATGVGRDLYVRSFLTSHFYGRHRAKMERFLWNTPDFVTLGLHHFAGLPLSKPKLVKSALSAVLTALGAPE